MISRNSPRVRLARARAEKLARLATRPALWTAARQGVVASVEHAGIPFRDTYGTIYDIGASRGQFALFAADRFPDATLICCEPIPSSRETLRQVLGDRIEIRPVAVGAQAGTADLQLSASDDSSSLLPIGDRQVAEFPGTQATGTISVDVIPASDLLDPASPGPRLMKIDVQGLELEVLRGCGDAISLIDDVFVECSFVELYEGQALAHEVIGYLAQHGLMLAAMGAPTLGVDGELVQADLLFRRRV